MDELKRYIRDIPDFPKKGIIFHDITPLLQNGYAFQRAIDAMSTFIDKERVDYLVGVESRGFIFASALAYKLGLGLGIVRKTGKLPADKINVSYSLEYGKDELEMHRDTFTNGSRAVLVDDLLATGGTAAATAELVRKLGAEIVGYSFLIELTELRGKEKLAPSPVWSVLKFPL
ncbi:MAG: adenine phosphoribosyltransferase [Candidatus Caldarchaeum sp.]